MKTNWNKFLSFISSALSEPNGSGSITRVAFILLILAWISYGYITYIYRVDHIFEFSNQTVMLIGFCIGAKVTKDLGTKNSTAQSIPDSPKTE
jgi:hypothetical protein